MQVTRQLIGDRQGYLIFVNKAPIIKFSKQKNTVDTSTFRSEFTALKNAVKLVEDIWYKLHMFAVPIEGPTNVHRLIVT